jgi:hypothetical protein
MTFDRNNPNPRGVGNSTLVGICVAIAILVIGTIYWGGSRMNNAGNNSGTPAQITGSAPASNNATTGSGGAAR